VTYDAGALISKAVGERRMSAETLSGGIHAVPAPDGYEGCVHYVDATRSWQPSVRRVGDTWWKNTWLGAGGAHLPKAEIMSRAEAAIRRQVELLESRGARP
jgi:hypothetical protein